MTTKRTTKKAPAKAGAVPERPELRAYLPDGSARPIKLDEQWQHIEDWYQYLCHGLDPDRDEWLQVMVDQWQAIEAMHSAKGKTFKRGARLRGSGPEEAPMFRLFQIANAGFYPPPELQLGFDAIFDAYLSGQGKIPLEAAFFGPALKGAGNFSKRYASRLHQASVRGAIAKMMDMGWPRSEAAEWLSNAYGGTPDADSMLRMSRGVSAEPVRPPPRPYEESFWEPDN